MEEKYFDFFSIRDTADVLIDNTEKMIIL